MEINYLIGQKWCSSFCQKRASLVNVFRYRRRQYKLIIFLVSYCPSDSAPSIRSQKGRLEAEILNFL